MAVVDGWGRGVGPTGGDAGLWAAGRGSGGEGGGGGGTYSQKARNLK